MKKRMIIHYAFLALFFIGALYFSNYAYSKTSIIAPAECPECLCIDAPLCVDVVVLNRGFPLVTREELINREYVDSPYKEIDDTWSYGNIILNSVTITILTVVIYIIIFKYENSRHRSR